MYFVVISVRSIIKFNSLLISYFQNEYCLEILLREGLNKNNSTFNRIELLQLVIQIISNYNESARIVSKFEAKFDDQHPVILANLITIFQSPDEQIYLKFFEHPFVNALSQEIFNSLVKLNFDKLNTFIEKYQIIDKLIESSQHAGNVFIFEFGRYLQSHQSDLPSLKHPNWPNFLSLMETHFEKLTTTYGEKRN